jgi:hypothetical protein
MVPNLCAYLSNVWPGRADLDDIILRGAVTCIIYRVEFHAFPNLRINMLLAQHLSRAHNEIAAV